MAYMLDSGDAIRGKAAVASKVDYTCYGLDGTALKQLCDGQLGTSEADVFLASGVDTVTTIILVNTDTSARTVNLYCKPSGGTSRNIIPTVTLGAGYSLHTDGNKICVYDTDGILQTPGGTGVDADTIWDAKGDLAIATGANAASVLTVGTNGYTLVADSGETTGLKWVAGGNTQGRVEILPYAYSAAGQGTWALIINAAYLFCGYIWNSTHTDGDNISYDIYLDAGTYTLCVLHSTINNCGIIDVDIDATEVDSFDCYSAGAVVNVKTTQTGIVIASAGRKTLKLRVDGKHASSSDYYAAVNWISLWRTA